MLSDSQTEPEYYTLEAITEKAYCQDMYPKEENQDTQTAIDLRYENVMDVQSKPNEFEIQKLSGVLE